jgi:branched-chain amino acid transport system substrate-binding protein
MGALSGGNASFVLPAWNGAKLALEQFKAAGRTSCDVRLVPFDTEGDPAKAAPVANKIAVDKTFLGVIGGAFSGETRQTKPIYGAAGVTMISPSATATDLSTQEPVPVFHRIVGHDQVQGAAIAVYLADVVKAKKVFVVDDGTAYGGPLAKKVVASIGERVVGKDRVQEKQTDFTATISKIESADPDAVFYAGYAAEAGPFLKQLRGAGVKTPFVGGDGLYGSDFPKAAGPDAEGAVVTCPCLPPSEVAGDFVGDYEEEYGTPPGSYAGEGFDAATIFLDAIAAGNTTRETIEAFVDAYDKRGVTKHLKFDERGDIDLATVGIWAYRIHGGLLLPHREIPLR